MLLPSLSVLGSSVVLSISTRLPSWRLRSKGLDCVRPRGEDVTELAPDGFGGFLPGRAGTELLFFRVLPEEVDSPTLRLDTGNNAVTVFLDGAALYTGCPELDNRIGYLRLSMLEWYREEPVLVAMPQNYQGKTLTITQSTDPFGGKL